MCIIIRIRTNININNHTWGIQRWAERMMKEREYGCINPIPPAAKNEFFREACFNPRECVVDRYALIKSYLRNDTPMNNETFFFL